MLLRQLGAPRDSNELERGVALFLRSFVLLLLGYVCFHKLFPFGLLNVRIGEMTGADFLLLIFRAVAAAVTGVYFAAKAFSHPGLGNRDRAFCERWAVLGLGTITIIACSTILPFLKGEGVLESVARLLAGGILWLLI
jgi:hypothetical protein